MASTKPWRKDPRVEVHGPGYSKVVLGPDAAADWSKYLDVMVSSIAENGGRSCVNASGVWVPSHAREIAEALAERLAQIRPRAEDDPAGPARPVREPRGGDAASRAMIDRDLEVPGAVDLTARHRPEAACRGMGRRDLPARPPSCCATRPEHPLANREFLFPFAAVVPVKPEDMPSAFGPTLAATAITNDQALLDRMLASPLLHRLNLGPMPTYQVSWDQPHEGNLFEHLYVRRALQGRVGAA